MKLKDIKITQKDVDKFFNENDKESQPKLC